MVDTFSQLWVKIHLTLVRLNVEMDSSLRMESDAKAALKIVIDVEIKMNALNADLDILSTIMPVLKSALTTLLKETEDVLDVKMVTAKFAITLILEFADVVFLDINCMKIDVYLTVLKELILSWSVIMKLVLNVLITA